MQNLYANGVRILIVSVCFTRILSISGVYNILYATNKQWHFFNNIPYKRMHLTSKVNLTKRFSEKYKCMRLTTRVYGIADKLHITM